MVTQESNSSPSALGRLRSVGSTIGNVLHGIWLMIVLDVPHSDIEGRHRNLDHDVEKANTPPVESGVVAEELDVSQTKSLWYKFASWGVELRGISPVPKEERTNTRYWSIFSLWFTLSFNLLPVITGMVGPLSYELGLRDSSLIILFFSVICTIPPAYCSTLGPKTGLRQMVQARYSFGLYLVSIPVILNLATITGFCVIDCIVGGQTLSAVTGGSLSINIGIVIIALLSLLISFCGYKVLHKYERYAWIPALIAIVIATGCGGKHLRQQESFPSPAASTILSFGALIAGFLVPWAAMASDFATYIQPSAPAKRIFLYTYAGLFLPTVPLMILGAAIGGAISSSSSWSDAYDANSAGGVLAAMLEPAGGFGKFVVVILAFTILGNVSATMYSVTLNLQMLVPWLVRLPRALFALVVTAILIPVSIKAAVSFFDALENFIGVIAYWAAAFVAIVVTEHLVFRRGDAETYDHSSWDVASALPTGIPAIVASGLSFGLVIPCMAQIWYTGPIAEKTGDIGFEMAFCVSTLLYLPLRWIEIKLRKGRV